jgi:hypothetical protein
MDRDKKISVRWFVAAMVGGFAVLQLRSGWFLDQRQRPLCPQESGKLRSPTESLLKICPICVAVNVNSGIINAALLRA